MIAGGRVRFTAGGRALHHRNFQLFFFGQLISVTGTWMQSVAQQWLMYTLVGNQNAALYLGLLGVVQFMPTLVLGLFGGMIADLWPKRRTVVLTQTASAVLALALAALVFSHTVQVWQVFVLGFGLGIVNAVDMPTRQAFVVEMVGRDDIANAIALNSAVFNGARIVGPAVAGILIGVVGTAVCFLFNGLSYIAVIVGLLAMRDSELLPADRLAMPKSLRDVRDNLAEGLSYVWQTPIVLLAISVIGLVSMFGMNFNVLLPALSGGVLNVGPEGFGFLTTAMGLGALIAALVVASMQRPMVRVLLAGAVVLAGSEMVLGLTRSYPLALATVFLSGAGAIAMSATANSLVQVTVPGPLRGRVMAVYTTVFAGSTPAGNGMTGGAAALWGTSASAFLNGATSAVVAVIAVVAVLQGRVADVGKGRRGGTTEPIQPASPPGETVIPAIGQQAAPAPVGQVPIGK